MVSRLGTPQVFGTLILYAVLLALVIVPYQFWQGYRLWQLQGEAAAVVTHVYEEKLATGEYPESLAGYEFVRPQLASRFR
jgi:hypothetical protein